MYSAPRADHNAHGYDGPMSTPALLAIPAGTFAFAIALHWLALRQFPRWKLLDFPERYGLLRPRLPYPTGIISVALFIVLFLAIDGGSPRGFAVVSAVALLGMTCFFDDRRQLPPLPRLAAQAVAAILTIIAGDCTGGQICSVTNPLEGTLGPAVLDLHAISPLLPVLITAAWLVLTTNALNWFDGIPGQTHTISGIAFVTIGLLSLSERVNQPSLALLAFVLAALAFGALPFDFPPAKTVAGDTGAMFFGLMLGLLTVYAGGKVATGFLVLGVPLLDSVFVVVRRVRSGRSPLRGSASGEHLHHRLLAAGWSPRSIIAFNAGIGTLFGVTALFLSTAQKALAALVLLACLLTLSVLLRDDRVSGPRT